MQLIPVARMPSQALFNLDSQYKAHKNFLSAYRKAWRYLHPRVPMVYPGDLDLHSVNLFLTELGEAWDLREEVLKSYLKYRISYLAIPF